VTKLTFRGEQRPAPSEADRLGRTAVGWKEETGFTENNDRFVQTADNPARFVTHYMTRYGA
jgi:protein phosphatase 1 regulatory subunit 32